MAFKNYRLNIIIRISILLAGLIVLSWSLVHAEYLKSVYLGLLIIFLAGELFYYTDRVNRDLNQFMMSIFHDDFTTSFDQGSKGRSFRNLYHTMNEITEKFRALSKEKETRGQYLVSLVEQVRVGIISFEPGGRVHLANRAFRELLDARVALVCHVDVPGAIHGDAGRVPELTLEPSPRSPPDYELVVRAGS